MKYFVFIFLWLAILAGCLGGAEWLLKSLRPLPPEFTADERNLFYQKDDILGWFPRENSQGVFKANREFEVAHNRFGFRDRNYNLSSTQPRIAILGDSFAWGYDANYDERFSQILEKKFPQWQWLNWGVSGYGTDQEFLLLQKFWPIFQPKIVLLIICSENDQEDSASNNRYGGYYKPYFERKDNQLQLAGVPVPNSLRFLAQKYPEFFKWRIFAESIRLLWRIVYPIRNVPTMHVQLLKEMQEYLRARGAKLYLAQTIANVENERLYKEWGLEVWDLSKAEKFPYFGKHWTPKGNAEVAAILAKKLRL